MWRVTWGDYRDEGAWQQPLYSPRIDEFRPVETEFSTSVAGEAGSLKLTLSPDHPAYGALTVGDPESWAEVYNDAVNGGVTPIWRGCLPETGEPIAGDSFGEIEHTFAGELSQLSGAVCPRFDREWADTAAMSAERACAQYFIDAYNAQVRRDDSDAPSSAGSRMLALGRVDDFGYETVSAADEGTSDILEVLAGIFVDRLGGYIRVVYADAPTVEILADLTDGRQRLVASQEVAFGENLVDGERNISTLDLYTGVKPYGADLGDTDYAGKYYSNFAQQTTIPGDWTENFGEYFRIKLFEPLTGEPAGWNLDPQDAIDGGMIPWSQYWYWNGSRFRRLSALGISRPVFLAKGADGIPIYWSCATDVGGVQESQQVDPYALAEIDSHMEKVGGFGWTLLNSPPGDWKDNASSYSRPVQQLVHTPLTSGETAPRQYVHWMAAADRYTRLTKKPKHWDWENGDGNYASFYRKVDGAHDPIADRDVDEYEAVKKVFSRLGSKPEKWKKDYTKYYWTDAKGTDGYVSIPSWQSCVKTSAAGYVGVQSVTGGWPGVEAWAGEKSWRKRWRDCRAHEWSAHHVDQWKEFEGDYEKVGSNNQSWSPETGGMKTVNKANWNELRGALYVKQKSGKKYTWSSKASAKWGKNWSVSGGKLKTSSSGDAEQLYYCKPKQSWNAVKSNCWVQDRPVYQKSRVYRQHIPYFSSGTWYKRSAPDWAANTYYVQRDGDAAPYVGEDPTARVWSGWAGEPVFSATSKDELPLTLDLAAGDGQLPEWLRIAVADAGSPDDFAIDGDILWDETAAETYGRRVCQEDYDDATTFQSLLLGAVRTLASASRPSVELEISAIDLSAEDAGSDPLLPGVYVRYSDPTMGYDGALMPLVAVSGIDFGDPTRGRVKLGSTADAVPLPRQRVAGSLAEARGTSGIVWSTSAAGAFTEGVENG